MPHDLMTQCEQKKHFLVDGKDVARRTVKPVSKLFGATSPNIRCMHAMALFKFINSRLITVRRITLSIAGGRIRSTAKEGITSRVFIGFRPHRWCEIGDMHT
jgi:hypothetical protein